MICGSDMIVALIARANKLSGSGKRMNSIARIVAAVRIWLRSTSAAARAGCPKI
jgi:hypothetical protein